MYSYKHGLKPEVHIESRNEYRYWIPTAEFNYKIVICIHSKNDSIDQNSGNRNTFCVNKYYQHSTFQISVILDTQLNYLINYNIMYAYIK